MYGKAKVKNYKKEARRLFWYGLMNFVVGIFVIVILLNPLIKPIDKETELQSVYNNCNTNEGYVSNIVINEKNTTFECWDLSKCTNIIERRGVQDYGVYMVENCTLTVRNMYAENINGRWVIEI